MREVQALLSLSPQSAAAAAKVDKVLTHPPLLRQT